MAENIQPGTIQDQEEVKVQSGRARAALPAAEPNKITAVTKNALRISHLRINRLS